jgi:hypothetical protein
MTQPPAATAAADDPAARSPGARVVTGPYVSIQVNVDSAGRNIVGDAANEPSIAVNPLNPQNLVIGWRQFSNVTSSFRQAGWAYSFNKGESWRFPGIIDPRYLSDPTLDVDSAGNFYYQALWPSGLLFVAEVFKSTDGGMTWGGATAAHGGDKTWLAIDRTGGPGEGFIYNIWSTLSSTAGANQFSRSIDGGATYQAPIFVQSNPVMGTLAVGSDGTVYAAGADGSQGTTYGNLQSINYNEIEFAHTTGPPSASAPPTFVGYPIWMGGAMAEGEGPNPAGLLGQVNVSPDLSDGPTRGNVYVVGSFRQGVGATDVMISRTSDRGVSFSSPVRINDDPPPGIDEVNTTWHWMAASSVAPNGRIDAMWFDTRDGGSENLCRLYYAYSWDAGATWSPNVAVTPQFDTSVGWPSQSTKIGDYMTLVSDATGADAAYAATFNGEEDVYYVRLFPDCNGNGVSDAVDIANHTSFDCNLNHVPDECDHAPVCIGAGAVAESGVSGALTIDKGTGNAIALTWGASCASADADYAVYEGSIGSFDARSPVACSTQGALSYSVTPALGNTYYLIVPTHADREGSYGTDGTGAERLPAAGACLPQTVKSCGS